MISKDHESSSTIVFIENLTAPIKLQFSDLCYTPIGTGKKDPTQILKNICGTFQPGKLTAIMGPSGAGKSSLLNVLSGFKTKGVSGSITVNGSPRDKHDFRRKSAYIQQDFEMLGKLTAAETLEIAADLKIPARVPRETKNGIIEAIVKMLKLEKCLKTYVDKLSGGEKKRLSIGTELVTNPPIMFFDEPTSGLDSASSVQVMTHLKELALTGRTILCVIHQPSSKLLGLFDNLYILSEGRCIYSGPVNTMVDTFKDSGFSCPKFYNRADFALEVASYERGKDLSSLIEKHSIHSIIFQNEELSKKEKPMNLLEKISRKFCSKHQYPLSSWQQFCILTRRNFLCSIRDFEFMQMRFIVHILIGILIGIVFYNIGSDAAKIASNISCIFFFLLFIFFSNAMPTACAFPLEAKVFYREHLNNWYSLSVYFCSKILSDIPFLMVSSTSFILIAYYMTGQPAEGARLLMVWGVCILLTLIAQTIGLCSGAAFSIQMGCFIIPATSIPMLIFSGFFIKIKELNFVLKPITYISYFRYGFEGSLNAIYSFNRTKLPCSEMFCPLRYGKDLLHESGLDEMSYCHDIIVLIGWLIILQTLFYITLKIKLVQIQ